MDEQIKAQAIRAEFNITTNRFKVWFDRRLTDEQYKTASNCNFVWFPGQKCFSSIWYPEAEDFIKSFGIEIEDNDTPDDVESRVNRFAKYATRAEESAESSASYAMREDITARRAKLAENRAMNETEKAAHWNRRIAGAIAHAQHKDRPDVIARRIKGLNTDLHRNERRADIREIPGHGFISDSHWIDAERVEAVRTHAQRWIEHLTRRIEYETACLEAVGGIELLTPVKKERRVAKAPEDGIKKGSMIEYRDGYYGQGTTHKSKVVSVGAHYLKVTRPDDSPTWYPDTIKVMRKFCKLVEA